MTTNNPTTGCGPTNPSNTTGTTGTSKNYGTGNTSTGTATCSPTATGTSFTVNDITSPGCYVCDWNGALLRLNDSCFDSSNNTYFSFSSNDTLTVTYLTDNPYASVGECRQIANSSDIIFNF